MAGYYNSLNYGFAYRAEDGKVLGRIREGLKIAYPAMGGQDFRFFVDPLSPVPKGYEGALQLGFTGFMSRLGYDCNQYPSTEEAWEDMRTTWGGKFVIFTPALRNNKYYVLEDLQVEEAPKVVSEHPSFFPIPVFYLEDNPAFGGDIERFLTQFSEGKPLPGISKRIWNKNQYTPMIAAVYRDESTGLRRYVFCMPQRRDAFSFVNISEGGAYFGSIGGFATRDIPEGESDIWDGILACRTAPLLFCPQDVIAEIRKGAEPLAQSASVEEPKEEISVESPAPVSEEPKEIKEIKETKETKAAAEIVSEKISVPAAVEMPKVLTEKEFLKRLSDVARSKALLYDEKDLLRFHLAAKTARLIILAGMSGTGKSALIRLYAEALGLPASQLAMIAVRPSWMDDSDLLGYLDMKNMTYRPADTGLSELLIEAEKNPEKLYIVCFDEMNLARAEHYFAQFISALENDKDTVIRLYNPALASRIYNSPVYPPEIHIGPNVIFTGTVNVDESTYHFSDKILDRANVITLHPGKFKDLAGLVPQKRAPEKEISAGEYRAFCRTSDSIALTAAELEFLDALNAVFFANGLAGGIGFRVVRQIGNYLGNIPEGADLSRSDAFDSQIVERIFTKLRGSGEQMKELIATDDKGTVTGAVIGVLDRYTALSSFTAARALLAKKARELKLYDYTI